MGGNSSSRCSSGVGSAVPGRCSRTNSASIPMRRSGKVSSGRFRGDPSLLELEEPLGEPELVLLETSDCSGERLRFGRRRRRDHIRGAPTEVQYGTVSVFTGKLRRACRACVSGGSRSDRGTSCTKLRRGESNLVSAQRRQ